MRPKKLTMQAFGSYGRKTDIDFTKPNQNLFLITGDTGAGKTTIFDAIVFAIYGEASSGYNKKDGTELQSQFVGFDITPFVELTFTEVTGGEEQTYIVKRIPRHIRARKKGSGSDIDVKETVTLTMPDGVEYSQNQKETDNKLEEIIGLSKSQFMQVAMIAQGEFMELLRADSNKKKEIFRKLFGTVLFQNIVDELARRRKDKLSEIANIRTVCQTEAAHVIVPETYESAEKLLEAQRRICSLERLNITDMEMLLTQLEVLCGRLEEDKAIAETLYEEAGKNRDAKRDAYNSAKSLAGFFEQLEQSEKTLEECRMAEEKIKEATEKIEKINAAYDIKAVYQRLKDAAATVTDAQKKRTEYKEALPGLEDACAKTSEEEKNAKIAQNAALEEYTKVSERVSKALGIIRKIAKAESEVKEKQEALKIADAAAEKAKTALADLEGKEQEWRRQAEEFSDAGKLLALWTVKYQEAESIEGDVASATKLLRDIKAQKMKVEKAQEEYKKVRRKYTEKNCEYVAMHNAFLDAQAGLIAKEKLREGEPCPVCGSIDHPSPCKLSFEHQNLTREMLEGLASDVAALLEKQNMKSGEAGSASDLLTAKEDIFAQAMVKLRERMAENLAGLPEQLDIEQAGVFLQDWKSKLAKEGEKFQKNAEILASVQESLKGIDDKKLELRTLSDAANQKVSDVRTALATSRTALEALNVQKDYETEEEANSALNLAATVKEGADDAFDKAHDAAQQARIEKENAEAFIKRYDSELPGHINQRDLRKDTYEKLMVEKTLPEQEWIIITKNHRKAEVTDLQAGIDAYNKKKASAEGIRDTARKAIGDRSKPVMENLEAAKKEAEDTLASAQIALEQLKETYKADKGVYYALAPKMEERSRIIQEYTKIDCLYNRLAGKVTGARMDIETFVQRYYLQRILYAANVRFRDMSAGQFELRMVEDDQAGEGKNRGLDFMVYSTVTGKVREVRTLSGGESFMAALSLALGMADQIQENSASINLEVMFIDEGFGSLDDHSRNQAVRVLQQMASGSKLIGIISHVTELKQEIENQLIVSKDEDGSCVKWQCS